MNADLFCDSIESFSHFGKAFKPHKYIALLTCIELIEQDEVDSCCFVFDEKFKTIFKKLLHQYGLSKDKNRPHTPFFHLSSASFWTLIPIPGKENELAQTKTIGSSKDLYNLVKHAEIDESVFHLFQNEASKQRIKKCIIKNIEKGNRSRKEKQKICETNVSYVETSLFNHEKNIIDQIKERTKKLKLGYVISNLEILDEQTNRYWETDAVLVCPFGAYVVELKHWSGSIQIKPYRWVQNGSAHHPDPHKINNFKAKLLRGLYERKFPSWSSLYFGSIVVLTNPEAGVQGASLSSTEKDNPTFDHIDTFFEYLKKQKGNRDEKISKEQCKRFVDYLQKLHSPSIKPTDFVFNGYEIVERLYQGEDRAEVIARRKDTRYRRLTRMRIFMPPVNGSRKEQDRFKERAFNTLNAVNQIGEHPNILSVWSVPNENGYIVEGSNWSDEGTLRDLMDQERQLSESKALSICRGIVGGLDASHNKGVIHRNLAPENILMIEGKPKLMNFDLSYQLADNRVTVISSADDLKRSPYIAPEIYRGEDVSESTDLFSLGVILYKMLTGGKPFRCSTDLEKGDGGLPAAQKKKLESFGVHKELTGIIEQLIHSDPSKRISNAEELTELFKSIQPSEPTEKPEAINPRLNTHECCDIYEIEYLISVGAESQIYKAKAKGGKTVTLKLFNQDVPGYRITREQEVISCLNHQSLLRYYSIGTWKDNRTLIAYSYVEGKRLRDIIGELPSMDNFIRNANALLDALDYMHNYSDDNGLSPILHNDIKPENILIGQHYPVLIDYGVAGKPSTGPYTGTEGYVAPDLRDGQTRQYCVNGDLFALGVTLFEWFFGKMPYQNIRIGAPICDMAKIREEIPSNLISWFKSAVALDTQNRFSTAAEMKNRLESAIDSVMQTDSKASKTEMAGSTEGKIGSEAKRDQETGLEKLRFTSPDQKDINPFVAYLNSMHSCSVNTANAQAESQACNELFPWIQVPHPVTDYVIEKMTGKNPCNVILTGHAGDGKSTVGLEVYKRLKKLPAEKSLDHHLEPRIELELPHRNKMVLIKDLSEFSEEEQKALLREAAKTDKRFFIISNTGNLLATFVGCEKDANGDYSKLESDILDKMDSSEPEMLKYIGRDFNLINLAMMDNSEIAEKLFDKMINPKIWDICKEKKCSGHCPVFRNIQLIQENAERVKSRLFLAYCRMREYGSRFTLRQISAHLAYMITSGLEYEDIIKLSKKSTPPFMAEFMFFNRFFGESGWNQDESAEQLKVVREIQSQEFGSKLSPAWERRLWHNEEQIPSISKTKCGDEFEKLRKFGREPSTSSPKVTDQVSRKQARRVLYFLNDFPDNDPFITNFLNSPMILEYSRWQEEGKKKLSKGNKYRLLLQISHVLQEHYAGIRLPEEQELNKLYITLNRRDYSLRQSAQIVLADIELKEFELELIESPAVGGRPTTFLRLKRDFAKLDLGLSFLDYVARRNTGDVGETLDSAYINRLEKFKAKLLAAEEGNSVLEEDLNIVTLKTNYQFRENRISVQDGQLLIL